MFMFVHVIDVKRLKAASKKRKLLWYFVEFVVTLYAIVTKFDTLMLELFICNRNFLFRTLLPTAIGGAYQGFSPPNFGQKGSLYIAREQ